MDNTVVIKDAYENNLKHIDLSIDLEAFTCVTGCSGCGKSSLIFDTVYAESQRNMLEGMGGALQGQRLMNKPKVGQIINLKPAISISQQSYNVNPRSTVGTSTDISDHLRVLFALVNSDDKHEVPTSLFSPNIQSSCCKHCSGLGIEKEISIDAIIPDREKTLEDGAILPFKGSQYSKERAVLMGLCSHYGIDPGKKVSKLTKKELNVLLYADDGVSRQIRYKVNQRWRSHNTKLKGAAVSILNYLQDPSSLEESKQFSKYLVEQTCHVCNGSRLKESTLKYTVAGLNYADAESMELVDLYDRLSKYKLNDVCKSKKDLVKSVISTLLIKIHSLIELNLGYLTLSRSVPSLSDGEKQRVRVASQFTCSLNGLIYILDEPCKGLHYRDVGLLVSATRKLVDIGNTVIAIEHNDRYIAAADRVIELGPEGGPKGGYLISASQPAKVKNHIFDFKAEEEFKKFIALKGINYRNIKAQDVQIPVGAITCITGVSGSGKSTLAHVVNECIKRKSPYCCSSFTCNNSITNVIDVNPSPIGKTPRSSVISYLGIYESIRDLFASTSDAKSQGLTSSSFSMNVEGERCSCCQGTGLKKYEMAYLPECYVQCPECGGKRFSDKVLSVKYNGLSIYDVLETPVAEIMDFFKDQSLIYSKLNCMQELGISYLKLGQMSMHLSGGEAQRIKLADALGKQSRKKTLFILDEPASGLSRYDIDKLVSVLKMLQNQGHTILMIEHNPDFIARISDYVIDFGMKSGSYGGKVVSQGPAARVFKDSHSSFYGIF
ncbi:MULTISPECIES: ATP-binding cassette domain-containing protein [unclassified Anaerobiospirillum]|uniref:ATP-binding cassette domain-containing protein n=1 Tax=unclassified Anaerobiospirillum TaxID=2647410 RepID=UPI001FF1AA79|nr:MULTISPECIES: ATP-binding cassette domain-containing protein [unclassified Anaerobiospirillum]MCK0533952.1 ATP-binding cassette domain-containing protein [Anaerobiospirillum sp. NML120511]MCK0539155.1 ATP-binding cassette domain-containing protein [Anaerobiospirillum sp. NML02-A-032]